MQKLLFIFLISLSLIACQHKDKNTLIVGTVAGPETELVEAAIPVAKNQYGLTIQVKEFSDYLMPNIALNEGSLDANIYQHQPYLEQAIKARNLKLTAIGKTYIYPMAIYSNKLDSLDKLKPGSTVAIPNDPSNEARALLLLQKAGLIKVKGGSQANTQTIKQNPKHLKIKAIDAASLPRVLPDVDLAVINTNFAIPAGLSPKKDGLFQESKDSPYANLIVIRIKDKTNPKLQQLVKALQSKPVNEKAKALFGDGAIPAF